jgi:septal ring factor EnvC (AmiA/AmiB activator)
MTTSSSTRMRIPGGAGWRQEIEREIKAQNLHIQQVERRLERYKKLFQWVAAWIRETERRLAKLESSPPD